MSDLLLNQALDIQAPRAGLIAVDDTTINYIKGRPRAPKGAAFEQAGSTLFTYQRAGRTATLNFHAAPAEALESPALMAPWARLAVEAALRARSMAEAKPQARKRSPRAKPAAHPRRKPRRAG